MKRAHWCAILDDDQSNVELLSSMLEEDGRFKVERTFNKPSQLLNAISQLQSVVLFLDIQMPEMDGIELADLIKGKIIVYVNAHREFAVESYEKNAHNYILKPLNRDKLKRDLDKLEGHLETVQSPWIVQTASGLMPVDKSTIIKITPNADGHARDKLVYIIGRKGQLIIKNRTLEEILTDLNCADFVIVRKDIVVNMKAIQIKMAKQQIRIIQNTGDFEVITVSDSFYKEFCQKYEKWSSGYRK